MMQDDTLTLLADCRALVDEAWAHQDRFDMILGQAEARLRAALAEALEDTQLLTTLGAVLCDRGRPGDAVPVLERAVRAGAEDRNTFFNLGVARHGSGSASMAMAAFTEAAALAASAHTWTAYFDPHAS